MAGLIISLIAGTHFSYLIVSGGGVIKERPEHMNLATVLSGQCGLGRSPSIECRLTGENAMCGLTEGRICLGRRRSDEWGQRMTDDDDRVQAPFPE